jgi:predicted outer membrane repeat protein
MDHRLTRLIAVASSSVLVLTILAAAPAAVRAGSTAYIGDGTGSGECDTPDYTTNGSADDVEFNDAVDGEYGDIDNILYVCPGTYDIEDQIYVPGDLTIEGVSGAAATVLDSDGTSRILDLNGDSIIRGLTFKDGDADGGDGGAIYSDNYDLTVEDSVFVNNQGSDGGAISADGYLDLVLDSTFTNNHADDDGGAIFVNYNIYDDNEDGESGLIGNTFSGNTADDDGGAVVVNSDLESSSAISGNTFSNNVADEDENDSGDGGAVWVSDDTNGTFTSNTFSDNSAVYGGAVWVGDDIEELIGGNTFSGNTANENGGALYAGEDFEGALSDNIFSGNSAGDDGGAVFVLDAITDTFSGNTFSGNTAGGDGGGIYQDGDDGGALSGTISGNRFVSNTATEDGGGLHLRNLSGDGVITRNQFRTNTAGGNGGGAWLDDTGEAGPELAVVSGNMFRSNRAEGSGGGLYLYWTDTEVAPKNVTRNSFRSNRAGDIGGGIAIMGVNNCVPELTTRQAARAFKKNKYASNRASGSRRSMNVGADPCVD